MRAFRPTRPAAFRGPRLAANDFRAAPSNAEAWAWLARTADWPGRRLALWGEAGRGKTHLLHIWAERTGAALLSGPDCWAPGASHRRHRAR